MNSKSSFLTDQKVSSLLTITQDILKRYKSGGINSLFIVETETPFNNSNIHLHLEQLIKTNLFSVIAVSSRILAPSVLRTGRAIEYSILNNTNQPVKKTSHFLKNGWVVIYKINKVNSTDIFRYINKTDQNSVTITSINKYSNLRPIIYAFQVNPSVGSNNSFHDNIEVVRQIQDHPMQNYKIEINNCFEFIQLLNIAIQNTLLKNGPSQNSISLTKNINNRPWGNINTLSEHLTSSVRILSVNAKHRLSLQRHVCRDELFISQDDDVMVDLYFKDLIQDQSPDSNEIITRVLHKGEQIFIERGTWHRLKAPSKNISVIEIGYGIYDQTHDIERNEDDYGRLDKSGAF